MYVVKKNIKGKDYFYLRKSVREGGKVKSKNIAYLGKNKEEAERKAKEIIEGKVIKGKEEGKKEKGVKKIKQKEKQERKIKPLTIDELTAFCKRKGFVFKSSEIYGGFSGFWDYGSLGVELFNNIKQDFWKFFVQEKENMVGIDSSIISHPKTWEASGHVASFTDVSVKCKKCSKFNKVDKSELGKVKCGFCGGELDKTTAKDLNLMFSTKIGPVEEESQLSYLRPETAQGMFLDFKQVAETSRLKLPFGILQIGKCFRNEIAPRDFLFRDREFTIGEFEFFIHPEKDDCKLDKKHLNLKLKLLDKESQMEGKEEVKETTIGKMLKEKRLGNWHAYWLAEQLLWFKKLGIANRINIREHTKEELSHYSSATFDLDYEYPFGSLEIAGNANRGQYDLKQHEKYSGKEIEVFDEESKKKIIPRVIEPTFGIDRIFLALICSSYEYDKKRENVVLKIPNYLAPIKAAIFPIVKGKFEKLAREVYLDLKKSWNVVYDTGGSIGRRYSRADEIGVPVAITVDGQSLKDNTITLRDRDTTEQIRIKIKDVEDVLRKVIGGENLLNLGKRVVTRVKEI